MTNSGSVITDPRRLEALHAAAVGWLVERGHAELGVALARASLVRRQADVQHTKDPSSPIDTWSEGRYWLEAAPDVRSVLDAEADWVLEDETDRDSGMRPGSLSRRTPRSSRTTSGE